MRALPIYIHTSLAFILSIVSLTSWSVENATDEEERQYLLMNKFLQDDQPEQAAYPIEGVTLGQGWDLVTGRRTQGSCITGGREIEIPGSSSTTQYKYLFDREQIYNSLGLTASASYGGFGWSASVNTSFSETSLADRSRTKILSTTLVDKGGVQLSPSPERMFGIRLSEQAGTLLEKKRGKEKFRKLCGDGFVMAIRQGGQLDVVYELNTALSDYSSAFNLSMSASGYGASGSMALDKKRRDTLNNDETNIRIVQSGGELSSPTTKEKIVEKIENFPNFEKRAAAPYRVVIWPYSMLPNWNSSSNDLSVMNVRAFFMMYQRLMDLSALYTDAQLRSELYYFPFYPNGKNSQALEKQATILRAAARCYEILVSDCMKSGKCSFNEQSVQQCRLGDLDAKITLNDKIAINSLVYGIGLARFILSKDINNKSSNDITSLSFNSVDDSLMMMLNSESLFDEINKAIKNKTTNKTVSITASDWKTKTVADLYYSLLANAPLKRARLTRIEGNITLAKVGDESRDALSLCENITFNGSCFFNEGSYYNALFVDVLDKSNPVPVFDVLSKWVLYVRLLPLSQTFCSQSLLHPMCRSPEQLVGYLPLVRNFTNGEAANFIKIDQTPTPPSKPLKPPREPTYGSCPKRICL